MFRITPKELLFFDMFVEVAEYTCQAAEKLEALMVNFDSVIKKINEIEVIEHQCDQHVHSILKQLGKAFITPIDREDIYLIAKEIDNITDFIESTAHRFVMFNIKSIRQDALLLAGLIIKSTKELKAVMVELKNMRKSLILKDKIVEVNRIENEGDIIVRRAIGQLFTGKEDPLEVIKWKEIYEYLEYSLDACEDVANIAEEIIMKHV